MTTARRFAFILRIPLLASTIALAACSGAVHTSPNGPPDSLCDAGMDFNAASDSCECPVVHAIDAGCPSGSRWVPVNSCENACEPLDAGNVCPGTPSADVVCDAGMEFDTRSCDCTCPPVTAKDAGCPSGSHWVPVNVCTNRCEPLDAGSACPFADSGMDVLCDAGMDFDPVSCACACPPVNAMDAGCPSGSHWVPVNACANTCEPLDAGPVDAGANKG